MSIDENLLFLLINWACSKPQVKTIFLYGSRVKGTFEDSSDLDIAIELDLNTIDYNNVTDASTFWCITKGRWSSEVEGFLPYKIHLEWLHSSTPTVQKAVSEKSILVYQKESLS